VAKEISKSPSVEPRKKPLQHRSANTIEKILDGAALLIAESGFERLTTNAICARVGMTPPALYRYFPNKYAVMKALAERLMAVQNQHLLDWCQTGFDFESYDESLRIMLAGQYKVTDRQIAGHMIMRTLHAVPILSEVRFTSHEHVTDILTDLYAAHLPHIEPMRLRRITRMSVEIGHAMLEYLGDVPDADHDTVIADAANIMRLQFTALKNETR